MQELSDRAAVLQDAAKIQVGFGAGEIVHADGNGAAGRRLPRSSLYRNREDEDASQRDLFHCRTPIVSDETCSTSGSFHALSNSALVGAYSRNISSNLRAGSVGTQFDSLPAGAFGPKYRSTEPFAFFCTSALFDARLARLTFLISAWVCRS